MGGPTWAQKGPATESKPQRAAPQAGRPTHKVRQHKQVFNTSDGLSCVSLVMRMYKSK